MADTLPRVKLIGTGGTISGVGTDRLDIINYGETGNRLPAQQLLDRIPEVEHFARVEVEQALNIGSTQITPQDWVVLARRINQTFQEDAGVAGIAITHGTASLEETAYFLNLTVESDKPVTLAGAMRPSSALGYEGEMNLWEAIRVAACPDARGKGTLVVMNEHINAARDVTKSDTTRVETFQSPHLGILGYADPDGKVVFLRAPLRKHTHQSEFSLDEVHALPQVEVVVTYAGAGGILVDYLAERGVPGVVVGGLGGGSIPAPMEEALVNARKQGMLVVAASRSSHGRVPLKRSFQRAGFVTSDGLSPQKARILLMLALTRTKDPEDIQRMFYEY